ncbi:DUF6271 family protein [Kitasatospora sp. NPDC087315]|uniref:DUF6271 family protein n=1 Tax=Kitasatospora sp. NPDC087315 TaxID=3364069 RepID=UPI0037F9B50B
MRRTCLALPTSRARPASIAAMGKEAVYAAGNFGVEVRLLPLDSSDDTTFTDHAKTVGELLPAPNVYERVPPPPATETVGSDHFLPYVVLDAALTGVAHNRPIVNYCTPRRRSGSGFIAHQVRLTRLPFSMLYFHPVYGETTGIGGDRARNVRRLDALDASTANRAASTPGSPAIRRRRGSACPTRPRPTPKNAPTRSGPGDLWWRRPAPTSARVEESAADRAEGAQSTPAGPRCGSLTSQAAWSMVARRAGQSRRPVHHPALNWQLL